MKLPESKKERIQVFVLIGIGALLAIFAVAQLAVTPFLASRRDLLSKTEEQGGEMEKAKKELLHASVFKQEYDSVTVEIDRIVAANVLRPILGSYLVGVTETIENAAREAGLKVEEIQEVGVRELPRKKADTTPRSFKSYAVQATGEGSYDGVRAFIAKMESDNPFLCVTEMRLVGRPENPERHRFSLRIEWPIEIPGDEQHPGSTGEKKGGES